MLIGIVYRVLPDQDTGFDSLAETDFIREQVTLDGILQHAPHDFDLVSFQFDGGGDESGHAEASASLRHQCAHEAAPGVGEKWRLAHQLGQVRRGVGDGAVPSYVDIARRKDLVVTVRETDGNALALAVNDTANAPDARSAVQPVSPCLQRDLLAFQRGCIEGQERRRIGRTMKILDRGPVP